MEQVSSLSLPRCILHATVDGTLIVIDVPQSVVEAQARRDGADLLSCTPMSTPFQKSKPGACESRKEALNEVAFAGSVNFDKIAQLNEALQHLRTHFARPSYCLHRTVSVEPVPKRPRKLIDYEMSVDDTDNEDHASSHEDRIGDVLTNLACGGGGVISMRNVQLSLRYAYPNEFRNNPSESSSIANCSIPFPWTDFIRNKSEHGKDLTLAVPTRDRGNTRYLFNLPPRSAFLLAKCEDTKAFRAASREYSPTLNPSRGRYDLILLDPPWPNRSARRKRSYKESRNTASIEDTLLSLDLDAHIAPKGCVAIWITNRPAIRELVLGSGGLFEIWNVPLVEEWTWLKVTERGEPIMPLNAHMRRPYEILLIGRSPENRVMSGGQLPADQITHRTIVATPDVHSRKPCLKYVFEQLLLQEIAQSYTALEIFARYLVSGWMSWGDEAVKYNEEGFWRK